MGKQGATHRSLTYTHTVSAAPENWAPAKQRKPGRNDRLELPNSASVIWGVVSVPSSLWLQLTTTVISPLKLWQRFPAVWSLLVHRPPPSSSPSNDAPCALHCGITALLPASSASAAAAVCVCVWPVGYVTLPRCALFTPPIQGPSSRLPPHQNNGVLFL